MEDGNELETDALGAANGTGKSRGHSGKKKSLGGIAGPLAKILDY